MKTFKILTLTGATAALLLTGCSDVLNQGGDTECKDFVSADDQKQSDAVNKMIKDQRGNEPSNIELNATKLSIKTYCQTVGQQSSKIKDAPHA